MDNQALPSLRRCQRAVPPQTASNASRIGLDLGHDLAQLRHQVAGRAGVASFGQDPSALLAGELGVGHRFVLSSRCLQLQAPTTAIKLDDRCDVN